ncbi:MAG: hypothetical protein UZ21_OP11001000477 [Microgenomates bacterium OLB22]|nr:MAG: hypothetical protein UZ21_OP11001000477 [Microgenomates bacterium OLB22]
MYLGFWGQKHLIDTYKIDDTKEAKIANRLEETPTPLPTSNDTANNWNSYKNDELGITLKYPTGWNIATKKDDSTVFVVISSPDYEMGEYGVKQGKQIRISTKEVWGSSPDKRELLDVKYFDWLDAPAIFYILDVGEGFPFVLTSLDRSKNSLEMFSVAFSNNSEDKNLFLNIATTVQKIPTQ